MVNAGEPHDADARDEERLDIAELLVVRPDATFFVSVEGEVIDDASIRPGDILVVDRSLAPREGDTVIAIEDGEFVIKVLHTSPSSLRLVSRNATPANVDTPFDVQGVVLWVIHKAR